MSTVAYQWRGGLAEARARYAWGQPDEPSRRVAELDSGGEPSRVLTLREFKGHVILPPGEPMFTNNLWLCYPGRRHAVTARSNTLLFDHDDQPAWGIGIWLSMAVDPDEPGPADGPEQKVPSADRVPLVVDGVERQTWYYAEAGLHSRAVLVDGTYYVAICPAGEVGNTRLVTR